MIDGFKKFIARGNMIDMAVGVVMGGAVTTVVNSIVNNLINPLVAMIFGKPDMDGLLAFTFNGATVSFGAILGALLNFLIIAVAVYFFVLVPINKFRDMSEALLAKANLKGKSDAADGDAGADTDAGTDAESQLTAEQQTVILLQEIRDQLAAANRRSSVPHVADSAAAAGNANTSER